MTKSYDDWLTEELLEVLLESAGASTTIIQTPAVGGSTFGAASPYLDSDITEPDLLPEDEEGAGKNVDMTKAEEFVLVLPKYVPTEAWGDPNSLERKQVQEIFNTIGGAATIDAKLDFITNTINNPTGKITGVRRILGTIILLESFAAVIRSFNEASAGFVFEGFLAALLRGSQKSERSEKGNLPIEDLIAFSELPGHQGTPVSLKLLSNKTNVEGSYTNLVDALFVDYAKEGMLYIVARKDGQQIALEQFHLDRNNFLNAIARLPNGELKEGAEKLLATDKLSAAQVAQAFNKLPSNAKGYKARYKLLQQTRGYSRRSAAASQTTDAGEEGETKINWDDANVAFRNPSRWGDEKFEKFFNEVEPLPDDLKHVWNTSKEQMDATFLQVVRKLGKVLRGKDDTKEPTALMDLVTREIPKWLEAGAGKIKHPESYMGGKTRVDYLSKVDGGEDKIMKLRDAHKVGAIVRLFVKAIAKAEGDIAESRRLAGPYTVEENKVAWQKMAEERGLLCEAAGGHGTQWTISPTQLDQIQGIDYKVLGTLPYSSDAAAKTAEQYMDVLYDDLYLFFKSAQDMSENANGYFFTKERGSGISKGRQAIKDATQAEAELTTQVDKEDK